MRTALNLAQTSRLLYRRLSNLRGSRQTRARSWFGRLADRNVGDTADKNVCATGENAFTLVEVLCAIVILGVALVGLTQGVTIALHSTKESELQTTAALFAAGQIETIRAEGGLEAGEKDGDCGASLPLYRWRQTIAPGDLDGLFDVDVVVEDAKSGNAIYDLRTLLFEAPADANSNASGKRKDSTSRGGRQ